MRISAMFDAQFFCDCTCALTIVDLSPVAVAVAVALSAAAFLYGLANGPIAVEVVLWASFRMECFFTKMSG